MIGPNCPRCGARPLRRTSNGTWCLKCGWKTGDGLKDNRAWCSNLIHKVANYCEHGNYPRDITAFDFGRALGRALESCTETEPYEELLRGLQHWEAHKERVIKELKDERSDKQRKQEEELLFGGEDESRSKHNSP